PARRRVKETGSLAAKDLQGQLGKGVAGKRKEARHRYTCIAPSLLASEQVDDRQRLVGPRKGVEMLRIDLADLGLELSDLDEKVRRQVSERDEALLELHSVVRDRDEEVGAGVGVDDR